MFKIISVERINDSRVKVYVRIDAIEWAKLKKKGQLGSLYSTDISNSVYRAYGVNAQYPTVSDRDNARGGIKWVTLYYNDTNWIPAPDNVIQVDFINRRKVA